MPRPRILTDEQRAEIARVALLRHATPSNKVLARRFGCSVPTIKDHVRAALKASLGMVPHETTGAHDHGAMSTEEFA